MQKTWKNLRTVALFSLSAFAAHAETPTTEAPAAAPSDAGKTTATQKHSGKKVKPSKVKKKVTNDAEGSKALDRFESDPVIKSKYQLNGQQLEVDPD